MTTTSPEELESLKERLQSKDESLTAVEVRGIALEQATDLLTSLSDHPAIAVVSFEDVPHLADAPPLFPTLLSLPKLRDLSLVNVGCSVSTIRPLSELLPRLESLNLAHNAKLGPRGGKALAGAFSSCTHLTLLSLSGTGLGHFGAQALGTSLPTTLTTLNLSHNALGADGLWKLAPKLSHLTQLETLCLAHNQAGDDGCLELARHLPPTLVYLDLSGNDVSDAGWKALVPVLHSIETLLLSHNRIVDPQEVASLKTLQRLDLSHNRIETMDEPMGTNLQVLDLRHNQIGDVGAGSLVEHVDDMPSLMTLELEDNPISEARMRILDLLLKHRTPRAATIEEPEESERTDTDVLEPTEEEGSLDEELVEEGREILQQSEDGALAHIPYDYARYLADGFVQPLEYGAFGWLFAASDEIFGEDQKGLLVRRLPIHPAGPMESVRQRVLEDFGSLQHEALVPILAKATSNQSMAFLYDSREHPLSLRECLGDETRRKNMPWKKRFTLLKVAAQGLAYLHADSKDHKRMFHGDLSSSTIRVSEDYTSAQLLDVGVSRVVATDRHRFASGEVVFGSRSYRCPRYERGSFPYDLSSDIFSFGIVLAEVLTGMLQMSKLDKRAGRFDAFYQHFLVQQPFREDPLIPSLPTPVANAFGQLIVSCLVPNVSQRPTASTLAQILEQLTDKL